MSRSEKDVVFLVKDRVVHDGKKIYLHEISRNTSDSNKWTEKVYETNEKIVDISGKRKKPNITLVKGNMEYKPLKLERDENEKIYYLCENANIKNELKIRDEDCELLYGYDSVYLSKTPYTIVEKIKDVVNEGEHTTVINPNNSTASRIWTPAGNDICIKENKIYAVPKEGDKYIKEKIFLSYIGKI